MKKPRPTPQLKLAAKANRQAMRDEYVAGLRDRRVNRPVTFVDRRKEANRKACRGVSW